MSDHPGQLSALKVAMWLMVLAGALVAAVNYADLLTSEVGRDWVEGSVLVGQRQAMAGEALYHPSQWQTPPYRVHLYGPVFMKVGGWALRLSGRTTSLLPGRWVSFLALLVSIGALVWIGRRHLNLDRNALAVATLLALGYQPVVRWAVLNRVDTLAMALGLVGLAAVVRGGWAFRLAPVFFALAVHTKMTAVVVPSAIVVWLLLERRMREAIWLVAGSTVLGGAWLWLLALTSDGGYLDIMFRVTRMPFILRSWGLLLRTAVASPLLPLSGAVALFIALREKGLLRLLAIFSLLGLAFGVYSLGLRGANVNRILEPSLASIPLVAWVLHRWRDELLAITIATAVAATGVVQSAPAVVADFSARRQTAAIEQLLQARLTAGQSVLTLAIAPALRAGARLPANDVYTLSYMSEIGIWDQKHLVAELQAGRIDVVIATDDLERPRRHFSMLTPEMREAVVERYRREDVLGRNFFLYVPESRIADPLAPTPKEAPPGGDGGRLR